MFSICKILKSVKGVILTFYERIATRLGADLAGWTKLHFLMLRSIALLISQLFRKFSEEVTRISREGTHYTGPVLLRSFER